MLALIANPHTPRRGFRMRTGRAPPAGQARINVLSAPYFPDFLAVSHHILFPPEEGRSGSAW